MILLALNIIKITISVCQSQLCKEQNSLSILKLVEYHLYVYILHVKLIDRPGFLKDKLGVCN